MVTIGAVSILEAVVGLLTLALFAGAIVVIVNLFRWSK